MFTKENLGKRKINKKQLLSYCTEIIIYSMMHFLLYIYKYNFLFYQIVITLDSFILISDFKRTYSKGRKKTT